ncbi:MAG: DUF1700 domain-containing protein [Dorea sp.]|jgi:uncharacterized membrane protein|nr:DUF1700 domain-containing protein [Dorea sp.]
MNRIEFMTELAALLQDIPIVERQEAMKYYNDYFDDAGEENEHQVIEELESPKKVAATIKADLGIHETERQNGTYGEFRETGYKDTRFEKKDVPVGRDARNSGGEYGSTESSRSYSDTKPPRSNSLLKVLLIIAIVIVGAPVIIPLALALIAVVFSCMLSVFLIFLSIVIVSVAIAITGIVLFCIGLATLIPEIAVGLALIGTGLILGVIGVIGTIAGVRLCIIVFPGIIRGIVWICRKPFQGRAVA